MQEQNKEWSGVGAPDRASNANSISYACFHILTHKVLESNGDVLVNELTCWLVLTNCIDQDCYVGRDDAPSILNELVKSGKLSEENAEWLRQFAKLLHQQRRNLTIDPLIEAARRIVLVRFAAGGPNG